MAFREKNISIKEKLKRFDSLALFPERGNLSELYLANDSGILYQYNGLIYEQVIAQPSSTSSFPPYFEDKTSILGSSAGAWVVRSLGSSYVNKELKILIQKTNPNNSNVGVRAVGSTFDLSFPLRIGLITFQVVSNSAGEIEIYSDSNVNNFLIIGKRATSIAT